MSKVMDDLRMETRMDDIKNVMDSFNVSFEQAMDALQIPADEREFYRDKISEEIKNE